MFGGKLLVNHIQPLNYKNLLLAVFNNQIYFFDLNEGNILNKIQLTQNLIKAWKYFQNENKIVAIDEEGNLIVASFDNQKHKNDNLPLNAKISSKKITKNKINQASIVVKSQLEDQYVIYFIQQNSLYQYRRGVKDLLSKQCNKILYASQNQVVIRSNNKKHFIKVLLPNIQNSVQKQFIFEHSSLITASVVVENTLIFADLKGKIYVVRNYTQNQKSLTTKLQWHVHQVNHLFCDQEYLYSCGQEGTVVMWHLRQNKRDFLPRIGTQIESVFVIEGIVYCALKDNSITAIDLSNDKLLKNYQTVINPLGFKTKSINENGFDGKEVFIRYSQSNNRNLLVAPGLSGNLQLINLNDGSNQNIQILPRNLVSRLDDEYPQPHQIYEVNFNKDWTLMCCSTYGVNHNYLHFYKNQGFNLQYNLISKVQNPHKGPIKILSYNNTFITYAQGEKSLRFWSKIRKTKKSIIQKEEEFFTCSGQINYRQKNINNCHILPQENLILVNYGDQLIIIDLSKKTISCKFKSKFSIQKALLTNKSKTQLNVILITNSKILSYQFDKIQKQLRNSKNLYQFQHQTRKSIQFSLSSNYKVAFLIKYSSKQVLLQFDLQKKSSLESFQNSNLEETSILSICYLNGKILAFCSDSSLLNLTNSQQIIKISSKHKDSVFGIETQQDSGQYFQNETFENAHKIYIQKRNVKKKQEVLQCLEKIQLQMYPSLSFSLSALSQKMFI